MKAYRARSTVMQAVDCYVNDGPICEGECLADLTADYCRRNGLEIDRGGNIAVVDGVGNVRHHAMTVINRGNVRHDGWETKTVHILLPGDTGYPSDISSAASILGRKGGASKSEAKSTAARVNGKKGGRPRKPSE